MLTFHTPIARIETPVDLTTGQLPPDASWIDALSPTEEEIAYLERVVGTKIPSYDRLVEIESSSRASVEDDHIFLSLPLVVRAPEGMPRATPIGFILSRDLLVTLHFETLRAFNPLSMHHTCNTGGAPGGVGHFLTIVECIIDHLADILERVGADLDEISWRIFSEHAERNTPRSEGTNLRTVLGQVGRFGDLTAKISDSLLGMGRMIPYVRANASSYISKPATKRLDSMSGDVQSLNDYETRLTDKIQLLVDATLGFTNVEQNNVFRVLTVFSIVGIPPTFFASMWGMNFKTIPEYDWAYGYAFGLTVIALSAILPALWFKWRGWW